jgi:hypothetical protein
MDFLRMVPKFSPRSSAGRPKSDFLKRGKGQSLIEITLLFPVLLIMLSGMVELGYLLTRYLALIDAARNAARFSSDSLYYVRDGSTNCDPDNGPVSSDFYYQTACLVLQELEQEQPTIELDLARGDDIIVSAFTVVGGAFPSISARHPSATGWSYAAATNGSRNQNSDFTSAEVAARLQSGAPSTGIIMVEIYYHYDHLLGLPWITAFLDNPLLVHGYTFMPLVSAEPTPTPDP